MISDGLLDSNILVAALFPDHEHHQPSHALVQGEGRFAIAAHSLAETYCSLTRSPYQRPPNETWAALSALRHGVELRSLTAADQFEAIRRFAERGLIGPLIYDALIGEVARVHGIATLLTWNTRHMAGLFPDLRVLTPTQYLRRA